jgi:hypothetical protein
MHCATLVKVLAKDNADVSPILVLCLLVSALALGCAASEAGGAWQNSSRASAPLTLAKQHNAPTSASNGRTDARATPASHTSSVAPTVASGIEPNATLQVRDPEPPKAPEVEATFRLPMEPSRRQALSSRYANLSPQACRAEVRRKKVQGVFATGMALGIATPMRLVGKLRDVRFVTPGPKSVHGMLDCRLVLLLDEVAEVLSAHDVTSVYVDGFYRPKAHLPGKKSPSQHAFGLAIDIHSFGMKDGRVLNVERDFAGRIGAPVCGEDAKVESERRESIELRNIVCALGRARVFNYLLTPNHDESHRNHLHGDIKRDGREQVVK